MAHPPPRRHHHPHTDDGYAPGTKDAAKTDHTTPDGAQDRGRKKDDNTPDWRKEKGPETGKTPEEKLKDPEHIAKHYTVHYLRAEGRYELRVNHYSGKDRDGRAPDPVNVSPSDWTPPLDANGKPDLSRLTKDDLEKITLSFKKDEPPAESLGFDPDRSREYDPDGRPKGDSSNEDSGGRPEPDEGELSDEYSDARHWRAEGLEAIDIHLAEREQRMQEMRDVTANHPIGADERSLASREQTDASEQFGEQVSAHAIRERVFNQFSLKFPEAEVDFRPNDGSDFDPLHTSRQTLEVYDARTGEVLGEIKPEHAPGKPGGGRFDQIWRISYRGEAEPDFVIHEAKAPEGDRSTRKLHPPAAPMRVVEQGHPDHFDDTLKAMERRGEGDLAEELRRARMDRRLDYLEARARTDETDDHVFTGWKYRPYNGYGYEPRWPLE